MPLTIDETIEPAIEKPVRNLPGAEMIHFKTHLQPDPTFYFGNRIIHELGPLLKQVAHDRVYLVSNPKLLGLYGAEIQEVLRNSRIACCVVPIEDGEDNKNFSTLRDLCETLVGQNISKASIILGFGGGCLTNIAGLAAGLIFRGIRYVEMPTTLMGITDSSLSNKQAINGSKGKNHFGIYYAPQFLFGDTHYLVSEPVSGKKAAIVEGIKNGLISDADLVDYFETALERPLETYSELDFHEFAYRIIRSKLTILERDPSEKASALTLEYGHTFGHAIEFLSQGKISHGFAVAKGMCIAAQLGHRLGYIPRSLVDRHFHLFGNLLGLDLAIPDEVGVDQILSAINSDNKKTAQGTKFVLLKKTGECLNPDGDFQVFVAPQVVRNLLNDYKQQFTSALPPAAGQDRSA